MTIKLIIYIIIHINYIEYEFIKICKILFLFQCILPEILKGKKYPQLSPLLAMYYFIVGSVGFIFIILQGIIVFTVDPINLRSVKLLIILQKKLLNYFFRCHPVSQDFFGVHYNYALIVYYWVWFKVAENFEIILLTIINGSAQSFLVIHHSVLSV